MSRLSIAPAFLGLAVFAAVESRADFVNGGFESGMTGWPGFGINTGSFSTWSATEGGKFALLGLFYPPGGNSPASFSQGGVPVDGGETLSFDLRQLTRAAGLQQRATVTWFDSDNVSLGSHDIFSYTSSISGDFETEWTSYTWTVPSMASFLRLEFWISGPQLYNYLGVDDVRLEAAAIPAPGAALLGILGLSVAGWLKRRST